ncbi:Uncharacterized conserved protein, DUF4415 family [Palleronia salina]|uniref:Uncharacterized conserved protein, DUF4415 family n=2 Tax=Palleronia TaxID=315422 RepID=A0A1M6HKZ5_9RHOB|nr:MULTISPECIES: BrnA antitoxin family protein [Palleronia]SEM72915.1 Uncharacterized conserved protein, DUF4415 family [Palleronia pelagia]SHJ22829.1 Uncharacterized conserved protein, DUF4415 family [Palleronia salina]
MKNYDPTSTFEALMADLKDIREEIIEPKRLPAEPPGWVEIATDNRPGKTRVTIRLDSDVARWFRDMGPGWQTRLNAVLRMFYDYRSRRPK